MSLFITKWRALRDIDRVAGEIRERYITDVPGQQAVYMEKRAEAATYIAAHAMDPVTAVPGPHLAAEAAATGSDALSVANAVMANASTWLSLYSPAIEAARISGKAAVQAAETELEVAAARDNAIVGLHGLFP